MLTATAVSTVYLNWEVGCDISEPVDEVIDGLDLVVFVGSWLEGT